MNCGTRVAISNYPSYYHNLLSGMSILFVLRAGEDVAAAARTATKFSTR